MESVRFHINYKNGLAVRCKAEIFYNFFFSSNQEFANHDIANAPVPGGPVRPDVNQVQHEHVKNVFL